MCDCWVGILNDYDQSDTNNLRLSNINSILKEKSMHTQVMAAQSSYFKTVHPLDYIDKRRGLAKLFNFCPYCGTKIDWANIRQGLK